MRPLRWWRGWLLLWLLAVLAVIVLSLLPPPPAVAAVRVPGLDKLVHFSAYFILAGAAAALFRPGLVLFWVGLGLALLGVAMELAQGALMPQWRSADVRDALANGLGVIAGLALVLTPLAHGVQWLEARLTRGSLQ